MWLEIGEYINIVRHFACFHSSMFAPRRVFICPRCVSALRKLLGNSDDSFRTTVQKLVAKNEEWNSRESDARTTQILVRFR